MQSYQSTSINLSVWTILQLCRIPTNICRRSGNQTYAEMATLFRWTIIWTIFPTTDYLCSPVFSPRALDPFGESKCNAMPSFQLYDQTISNTPFQTWLQPNSVEVTHTKPERHHKKTWRATSLVKKGHNKPLDITGYFQNPAHARELSATNETNGSVHVNWCHPGKTQNL